LTNSPDKFKKTILEMYIREKEEDYFKQHEEEFVMSPVSIFYFYFFPFIINTFFFQKE